MPHTPFLLEFKTAWKEIQADYDFPLLGHCLNARLTCSTCCARRHSPVF